MPLVLDEVATARSYHVLLCSYLVIDYTRIGQCEKVRVEPGLNGVILSDCEVCSAVRHSAGPSRSVPQAMDEVANGSHNKTKNGKDDKGNKENGDKGKGDHRRRRDLLGATDGEVEDEEGAPKPKRDKDGKPLLPTGETVGGSCLNVSPFQPRFRYGPCNLVALPARCPWPLLGCAGFALAPRCASCYSWSVHCKPFHIPKRLAA